jgi:hypothetical protein
VPYNILVGNPERKRSLGRPKGRYRIILKRTFKIWVVSENMDWIN